MSIKVSTNRGRPATETAERFEAVFDRHYLEIYRYCARRVERGAAEDLAAEVFAVAWRKLDTMPEGERERSWLIGVAYKVVGNHYRSGRRRKRLTERLGMERQVHAHVASPERSVFDALDSLSGDDREILRLSAWDGLTNPEIAVVLDISENAVAQRLFRARNRFKKNYEALVAPGSEETLT